MQIKGYEFVYKLPGNITAKYQLNKLQCENQNTNHIDACKVLKLIQQQQQKKNEALTQW